MDEPRTDERTMAVRVELPDEPNTLGRIASALGGLGANILHIDVHELDGTHVIDEIVVAGPASLTPMAVREALIRTGARSVVSVPAAHRQMDALVRSLTALAGFVRDPSDEALVAAVADVVPVDSARLAAIDELDAVDPGARQLRGGVPAARCVDRRWILAVPRGGGGRASPDALVVARSVRFSATEVGRLRALLELHGHLTAARAGVR